VPTRAEAPVRTEAPAAKRRRPWVVLVAVYAIAGLIWWTILHPK
jgi:hypothetical protein